MGLRWSAGHPGRRLLVTVTGLACLAGLASFWALQGQFRGWSAGARSSPQDGNGPG